ncbi:response regulator [Methanofollis formosanus]|uniref:response regulator n=1 Tax=Methanofollis formosanus TaxID=299308 RepID=UPI001C7D3B86|nr:response regulator [Methanofollis formosanus]
MSEIKPAVLIVDDTGLAKQIGEMLLSLGYRVTGTAATPAGAFRQVVEGAPDLVLMNIDLRTTFDGIDTADFIFHCLHTPVVFLATHAGLDPLGRARKAEPIGYVVWPSTEASFGAAIEDAYHTFLLDNPDHEEKRTAFLSMMARDDAYLLTGKDGGIIFMNWFACRLTGWGYEEAFLRPLPAVLVMKGRSSPPVRFGRMTLLNDIHAAALLDRPSVVRVNARDGRNRTARLWVDLIADRDGNEVGHLVRLKEILGMAT